MPALWVAWWLMSDERAEAYDTKTLGSRYMSSRLASPAFRSCRVSCSMNCSMWLWLCLCSLDEAQLGWNVLVMLIFGECYVDLEITLM